MCESFGGAVMVEEITFAPLPNPATSPPSNYTRLTRGCRRRKTNILSPSIHLLLFSYLTFKFLGCCYSSPAAHRWLLMRALTLRTLISPHILHVSWFVLTFMWTVFHVYALIVKVSQRSPHPYIFYVIIATNPIKRTNCCVSPSGGGIKAQLCVCVCTSACRINA